ALPPGPCRRATFDRGRLVVGVPRDALLFGYPNPNTGQLEGFDVDLAKQVGRAIFGADNHVDLRPLVPAQRVAALRDGSVDLVADMLTMTCDAWRQIDLSAAYYTSGQRVLVTKTSTVQGIQDLGGKRVCAP